MDLKTKLKIRVSKQEIENLIRGFEDQNFSFDELIDCLQVKESKFQASWLMTHLVEKHPNILNKSHLKVFGDLVKNNKHEGLERNIWRTLSFVDIPPESHEDWINLAFDRLEQQNTAIAIQAFAMTVLEKLLTNENELRSALKEILELKLERQPSPGIRSIATKTIKKINSKADKQ
ncbi:hypothetical protein [Marivirga harenae]|uniref:hypothetical protein n=1 Tax=Marivirga harenae TaxID=2010992 RepID=UPI0026DEA968|nr:hypothetical protein [Marivirga harenae]WKV12670.1 hypothetical protein Q3Y49_02350 [Marivirga harenae]